MPNVFAFIMAGGSGERFWPMSRTKTPKHLLRLLGDSTLLEETARRFMGLVPPDHIFVLTNRAQLEGCMAAVPWLPPAQFVAEPAKRDTAPAAALANAIALSHDPHSLCALFPADAMIHDTAAFQRNFLDGIETASRHDALLTFAVPPAFPSTGFGYLEHGDPLPTCPGGSTAFAVRRFVEKPALADAEKYVSSGGYSWNAGMFLWRASLFQSECERLQPELAAFANAFPTGNFADYLEAHFPSLPKISVDYAIMEKAKKVVAVQAAFDWDDVGTWSALPAHLPTDADANTLRGAVTSIRSKNSIAISNGRAVVLCGVSDLVVVETHDAILVCHRDAIPHIKEIQAHLPENLK